MFGCAAHDSGKPKNEKKFDNLILISNFDALMNERDINDSMPYGVDINVY